MKRKIISILIAAGLLAGTWDTAALAQDTALNDAAVATEAEVKTDLSAELAPQAASYAQFNTSSMYAIENYGIKKLQNKDMLLKVPGNKNGRQKETECRRGKGADRCGCRPLDKHKPFHARMVF